MEISCKMVALKATILVITLNISGFNIPMKR